MLTSQRPLASRGLRPGPLSYPSPSARAGGLFLVRNPECRLPFIEHLDEEETMDHSKHIRLADSDLTAVALDGATIYGPGDDKIGSVSHLHGTGPSAQVVIDVGGFLGIGAKPVAVPMHELEFMRDEDVTSMR